jgi:hypothetical protein
MNGRGNELGYWVHLLACKWLNVDEIMKSSKGAVAKASSRLALRVFAGEHGADS